MGKRRYIDEDGFVICPGVERKHAAHISEFYTKDPDVEGTVWWVDPSGKEYGRPGQRCKPCTIKRQTAYAKDRRSSTARPDQVTAQEREEMKRLRTAGYRPVTDEEIELLNRPD